MNNSAIKSIFILGGLSSLLAVVVVAFWFWAGIVRVDLLNANVFLNGKGITTQQEKLQIMKKEIRDTRDNFILLRGLIITEDQVPDILNNIESLGTSGVDVSVQSVSVRDNELTVSTGFIGSFSEAIAIMGNSTDNKYASYINSFEVHQGDDGEWEANMNIAIPIITDVE